MSPAPSREHQDIIGSLFSTFFMTTITGNENATDSLIPNPGYGVLLMLIGDGLAFYGFKKIQ